MTTLDPSRPSPVLAAIAKLFFFEHGARLLRPNAATWLFSIWLLTTAMALLEGVTWARVLAIYLPESYVGAAIAVGVGWGIAIWLIDASFATLDTAPDYARIRADARRGIVAAAPTGWQAWAHNRLLMGTLIRVCIISFSMALTGPFLAKSLDERKVTQAIEARNDAAMSALRARIAAGEDEKIKTLEDRLTTERGALVHEIAGRNGFRGDGPVAKAMRVNIERLEQEIEGARAAKVQRLAGLSSVTPQALAQQEGLVLMADNADSRAAIRQELSRNEDTLFGLPASHVLASSLFLLLFLLMLVLKIFSPKSAQIYLNDVLQEHFAKYLRGGFATLPQTILPASDRHDGLSPMQAQRFNGWFHDKFLPSEEAIEFSTLNQAKEDEAKARLQRLKQAATALQERRDMAAHALSAGIERQGEIACEIACRETDVIQQERQIMTNEASIQRIRSDHLAARHSALQREHEKWVDRLATLRKDLSDAIPAQLAQTMAAIQTAHHREGRVVAEGAPSATTFSDPVFAPLFARRNELLERRHAMEQEVLQVGATIERVECAMLALKSESAEAVRTLDIYVPEQAEDIRLLTEACDRARRELGVMQRAKSTLEEQLRQCVQQVRDRTEAHDHECEACRNMQAAVREGESSLAGVASTLVA